MAAEAAPQSAGGFSPDAWKAKIDTWVASQHPGVEVAMTTLGAAAQGAFIGYLLGSFSFNDPSNPNAAANPALAAMQAGGPWGQARNLAVMTGVNAGASLTIKKYRGGKEDVWGSMGAAFLAGSSYSLVSGAPNPIQAAATTGAAFAAFNGLFYQVGKMFQSDPDHTDEEYAQGKYMLATLGLQKFENNLKKGQLTDSTIMLWNDSALAEARIPPGPRLLILHHLDQYRNPGAVLKPALPLPMPPQPAVAAASQQLQAGGR